MSEQKLVVQPAEKRLRNFSEVVIGLNKRQAVDQAKIFSERQSGMAGEGCPLKTDMFAFLQLLSKGDVFGALLKIKEENPLPAVTGRLCQEPYEQAKVYSKEGSLISLRQLERFCADACEGKTHPQKIPLSKGKRVAVVGSGPSGLVAAAQLRRLGYAVSVFECFSEIGGVLRYGIPEFRLPKKALDSEICFIQSLGVDFYTDILFGQTLTAEDLLKEGYHAVYLSIGAGIPKILGIPGEDAAGVVYADDFLKKVNLMHAHQYPRYQTALGCGRQIVVIGGGNAAVDCARICRRMDRQVTLVIRSTEDDMKVKPMIVEHIKEEGIRIESLLSPVEILKDEKGRVAGLQCKRFDYVDEKGDNQWALQQVDGSEFVMEADTIIIGVGHERDEKFIEKSNLFKQEGAGDSASLPRGVFAGGSWAEGAGPVLWAMVSAKKAVSQIDAYLSGK